MVRRRKEPPYTVIQDTREQKGYSYEEEAGVCLGTICQKLDTGDYTLLGFEDQLCVERKASVSELALNLGRHKQTFMREIERMKEFPHRFLLLEFSLQDLLGFPENAKMDKETKSKVVVSSKFILKCINEFQIYDQIHVIFAGSRHGSQEILKSIFKRINEKNNGGRNE